MWIICAYYTKNTAYENHVKELKNSLSKFNLSFDGIAIKDLGDWYKNIQYKPTFIKQMLEKYYPFSIVYVDADAVICGYPSYFDKLEDIPEVNMAVHLLDHSKYGRKNRPPELLSGTIFLKNTATTNQIVDKWIQECKTDPKVWDQRALATVLRKYKYHLLPEEYCTIFDYMSSVKNPVIKHFQASRETRGRTSVKKKRSVVLPRKVVRNGVVCIRRTKQIS